ncbi:hypothetical protein CPB85DRAFT_1469474 [Mucidula mucida]|nr:hypothetical protein CPB85DRAFT_1469474 [Mucidula mucida]
MSSESHTAAFGTAPRPPDMHYTPDTSHQTIDSETCASLDNGEDVEEIEAIIEAIQASDIPASHTQKTARKRRKVFSVKLSHSHAQKANDPFDYQHKYPEDAPFQEMGEMARVWKMFLEEYIKYDAEMVEDWRDGLDVLLVFAGLFSAVVTTFLVQTLRASRSTCLWSRPALWTRCSTCSAHFF